MKPLLGFNAPNIGTLVPVEIKQEPGRKFHNLYNMAVHRWHRRLGK